MDIDMDIDSNMAVSIQIGGSLERGLGLLPSSLGLVEGRFRAVSFKSYMAVSINWGILFLWCSFFLRGGGRGAFFGGVLFRGSPVLGNACLGCPYDISGLLLIWGPY